MISSNLDGSTMFHLRAPGNRAAADLPSAWSRVARQVVVDEIRPAAPREVLASAARRARRWVPEELGQAGSRSSRATCIARTPLTNVPRR